MTDISPFITSCFNFHEKIHRKESKGKKANHCQPKGYLGQREVYGKAFSEYSIYDTTSQIMLNSHPKYASGSRYKQRTLPDWIEQTQLEIQTIESQNIHVKAIYGDREFYQGISFAFATLGLFSGQVFFDNAPRLCVPKKWYNGIEGKWDFLLDSSSNEVEVDAIELNHYHKDILGYSLQYFPTNSSKTRYKIPFYSVATFDAYSNRKRKRKLDWHVRKQQKLNSYYKICEKN